MVERFPVTVPTEQGEEERLVYIYLPQSYFHKPKRRYPVLYMFDGHNVFFDADATFGKSWGMERYMEQSGRQLIIVAVECSHAAENGRLKEYAPFSFQADDVGEIIGRGKETMDWFAYALKPAVDAHFRTKADRRHTFLAGSSMGGLMTLYGLTAYPHIYSRGAALSPSLWVDGEKSKTMLRHAELPSDVVLYMDYGALEFSNHKNSRRLFAEATALLMEKGVLLNSRIVPKGTHCEASWERQIPFFMKTLFDKI